MNKNDNIPFENEDGLRRSAPLLFGLKKENSFSAPEGYFENFTQKLNEQLKTEEYGEESPVLSVIPKTQLYQSPEGYFEKLPSELSQRISDTQVSRWEKLRSLVFQPKFSFSLVGVAATVVLVFLLLNPSENTPEPSLTFSDVSKEEMDVYMKENILPEMTDDELATFVAMEDNFTFSAADNEKLEEFILDNVELYELENEL